MREIRCRVLTAQHWEDDWRAEHGASWPTYTLELTVGDVSYDLEGWHFVGRDHTGEWVEDDSDGALSGLPHVEIRDGCIIIQSYEGSSLDDVMICPMPGEDINDLAYEIQRAIQEAADEADHGAEPTIDDVLDGRWTYEDEIDEYVTMVGIAPYEYEDGGKKIKGCHVCGYIASWDEECVFETEEEARRHATDAETVGDAIAMIEHYLDYEDEEIAPLLQYDPDTDFDEVLLDDAIPPSLALKWVEELRTRKEEMRRIVIKAGDPEIAYEWARRIGDRKEMEQVIYEAGDEDIIFWWEGDERLRKSRSQK